MTTVAGVRQERERVVGWSRSKALTGLVAFTIVAAACGSSLPESSWVEPSPVEGSPAGSQLPPSGPLLPGAIKVIALGDSLTQGDCDDSARGYPGRLLPFLEKVRPGSTILNVGHSGWTSGDLANTANDPPTDVARAIDSDPDVALVWIGSNDLWALYENGPEPMTAKAEQEDLAAYEANLDVVLTRLADHGVRVYIALLDDQSKRPVVASPQGEPAFPGTTSADLALMSAHVTAYNDVIRRKAGQYGASVVDFFATTLFTTPATLCSDGNHPNEAGYDAIAALWFAALAPALK